MSFCSDLKNELVQIRSSDCCKPCLIYGFMMFGRSFCYKRISMQTNNENMALSYREKIRQVYNIDAKLTCGGSVRPTYKVEVESESDRLKILASLDFGIKTDLAEQPFSERECCSASFIRGAFLACGNINNPEKEYRIEFIVRDANLAEQLLHLINKHNIELKTTMRGKNTVIYTKESSGIEDLLTLMGATNITLDIIDTKIMKSVKNNTNRARNCDNANITKTVEASIRQRKAIDGLLKMDRLYSLPQELINAAILRQDNPEATLTELCKISDEPITVSGLNHRLKRIVEIYEKL